MTTSQPPPLPRLYSIYCRSRLAGDDDLKAAPSLSWLSRSIVEPACQLLQFDRRISVGDRLAVRPPSPASRLLQFDRRISVGDRLAVRPPSPASRLLQFDWCASVGYGSVVRPPSLRCDDPTSQLLQGIGGSRESLAGSALERKNQCTGRQASPWQVRVVLSRGLDVRPDLHLDNNKISGDP
jgi:hypothetical protein